MNIVIMGAPGAGKGTQAFKIAQQYGLVHISTGDIFRANIKAKTELGVLAKGYIDKGQLVPDDVTVAIVAARIKEDDCKAGFMLDGFPRTKVQAEKLDEITVIDKALNIEMDLDKLLARLVGRRICKSCGKSFHVSFYDKSSCDECDGEIYQRPDDKEETVASRLDVYKNQTAPLIEYYEKMSKLVKVDGGQDIDKVFLDIQKVL